MPDAEIVTRRDHDGIPIVKLLIKPKFKYDLDKILSTEPDEMERIQKETLEAIL